MADKQKLPDEVKAFIVSALACYDTPSVVAAAVKAEFSIEVSRQAVEAYDPTKKQGAKLSKALKALFEKSRDAFRKDTDDIPASHKSVRIRRLGRMAETLEARGNYLAAAQLYEQIAREMGDGYTNKQKHELSGKDGAPLPPAAATIVLSGRPQSPPAPQTVGGAPQHRD